MQRFPAPSSISPVLFQNSAKISQTILADMVFRISSGLTEGMDTAVQVGLAGAVDDMARSLLFCLLIH